MSYLSPAARDFAWLLNRFVEETDAVVDAIAVSADGILLCSSEGIDRASAEQLGAITSGLLSLTQGAARCFHMMDDVKQIIVEMGRGYLFTTAISLGASLGVLA